MGYRGNVAAKSQSLDDFNLNRHLKDMQIYKIFLKPEWVELDTKGQTDGAPVDLADGFIHFSTAAQAGETAAKYFSGIDGLMLVAFEAKQMGDDLKWEPSRGGDLFPHLYRALRRDEVLWAKPLPFEKAAHIFPPELTQEIT